MTLLTPYTNTAINLSTTPLITLASTSEVYNGEAISNVGFGGGDTVRFEAKKIELLKKSIEDFNEAGGRYFWLSPTVVVNMAVITAVTKIDNVLSVMYPGGTWKSEPRADADEIYARYLQEAQGIKTTNPAAPDTGKPGSENKYKVSDKEFDALLGTWGRDLTREAELGHLQPITGRDDEIAQVTSILLQAEKGNPILLGEAGVGKTALAEGLAQNVAAGNVPAYLKGARVIALNLSAMDNTKWKGEFQGKIFPLLDGIVERNTAGEKIILFVDEIHAGMKAGRAEGQPAVADYLKPYLTNPKFRLIGATTEGEYYEHITRDEALDRRFLPVHLGEPGRETMTHILEARRVKYEAHYGITIPPALPMLVYDLTQNLQPNLHQPDKSIAVFDNACSKAVMAGSAALGSDHILEAAATSVGMPKDFLKRSKNERYATLCGDLETDVLGQEKALEELSAVIKRGGARLNDPEKPLASVLLTGPKGSGKTLTGYALAEHLGGGKDKAIYLDLSLFNEPFSAKQKLLGVTSASAGNGKEGELTGPVRRRPSSTVIFDNIDKAHPEILALVRKITETGMLTDEAGKKVSFRNSTVVLTSAEAPDPDLVATLSGTVTFNTLTPEVCGKIAAREAEKLNERLRKEWRAELEIDPAALDALAVKSFDPSQGARATINAFETAVANPLASWLMDSPTLSAAFNVAAGNDNNRVVIAKEVDGKFSFALKPAEVAVPAPVEIAVAAPVEIAVAAPAAIATAEPLPVPAPAAEQDTAPAPVAEKTLKPPVL